MEAERSWAVPGGLGPLAAARGKTVVQMALGWLLSKTIVTIPILGPRACDPLTENLGAVGLRLRLDEMAYLDSLIRCYDRDALAGQDGVPKVPRGGVGRTWTPPEPARFPEMDRLRT